MAAPKGNRFWEARTRHGPPERFTDPEVLWAACVEYFEWNEANPLETEKLVPTGGKVVRETEQRMRPLSIGGLCLFIGITRPTWVDWRQNRKDLVSVIANAEEVISRQKFEGASAGLLNANIISRELGLADRVKNEHSGQVDFSQVSDKDLEAQIQKYLSQMNGK
jgi:hypothetical protein